MLIPLVWSLPSSKWSAVDKQSLPYYYPEPSFELVHGPTQHGHPEEIGESFFKELLNTPVQFTHSYTDDANTTHAYCVQTYDDIPISNHRCAIHIHDHQVISWSSSFSGPVDTTKVLPHETSFTAKEAAQFAQEQMMNIPVNPNVPIQLEYTELEDGTIAYVYVMELENPSGTEAYQVYLDANSGQIVHAIDFIKRLTYKAIPIQETHPQGRWPFKNIVDPEFYPSSPVGWTSDGVREYKDTRGNNAVATINGQHAKLKGNKFTFNWNKEASPSSPENRNGAIIQAFFVSNIMHDIAYQYGFTEAAGNFQANNFGRGGVGDDAVIVLPQRKNHKNNADFAITSDGEAPHMNLYFFDATKPHRDVAFQNDVIIHEYVHGISTRMTGDPHAAHCLSKMESAGLGEGWSDIIALIVTRKPTDAPDTKYTIGAYSIDDQRGFRRYPYTVDMSVNPHVFSDLNEMDEEHDIGEVWTTILNDVYWVLAQKYGVSQNLYDSTQFHGNIVLLNLIFKGFSHQPCNPTFLQARDAILIADRVVYQSRHRCDLWKGFARRGMGVDAYDHEDVFEDGFNVPKDCIGIP